MSAGRVVEVIGTSGFMPTPFGIEFKPSVFQFAGELDFPTVCASMCV
jgi:hypothetical protein